MDLRSKLARLPRLDGKDRTAALGGAPAMAVTPATSAASAESVDAKDAGAPDPGRAGGDKIGALRTQLAELMARSRAKDTARAEQRRVDIEARLRETPLPFDEQQTPLGPLHVRQVVYRGGHVVGRIPLRLGFEAHAAPLALLALDDGLGTAAPRGALYFDTESTGLAGGTGTLPFLVGLAWFDDAGALVVEQLLLRRLGDEAPMLARVAELVARASMLVSFNGKSFDWPLLRTRFVMNRLPVPAERPHLDLVHVARRIHRAARGVGIARGGPNVERWTEHDELERVTSCKLTALERQVLGFVRVDDVPSAEVPARYAQFLRHGDADAILAVCDHNLWDVVSMVALVGVYADAVRGLDDPSEREAVALGPRDMVGLARTLRRAGDLPRARRAADLAVEASGDDRALAPLARHTRGAIAKGAHDTETALEDYGVLADEHDDPKARLELAKLYEHRLADPARALEHALAGTDEPAERAALRRARLERKATASHERPRAGAPRRRSKDDPRPLPPSKPGRS